MATLNASNVIPGTELFSQVSATPETDWDTAFDSLLISSRNPCLNFRLRIDLHVFLKQITANNLTDFVIRGLAGALGIPIPAGVKVSGQTDADDSLTLVKDWKGNEWSGFVNKFSSQANMWNCKFWLIPPDDFTLFEFKNCGISYRPNVRCEFKVKIIGSSAGAHTTIEVANVANPTGSFRSHSQLYSVEDVGAPASYVVQDSAFNKHTHSQFTVAHEIGHALGLPHIGVTRTHGHCSVAILFDQLVPDDYTPAIFKGGSNAQTCYGSFAGAGDASNIMGYGSTFAPDNASPWLDRIPVHVSRPLDMTKWKASMIRIAPKRVR